MTGLLLLLASIATNASAQNATSGSIAGVVKDTTGAVLPGVTVEAASPALIEKVRVVVTDDQGNYKLLDLRPGPYTVTFTLPGFSTFKREGIELTTGFTATANAEMKVGSLEETVTVTGASPVVDVQRVTQANVLSREVIDTIPTGRTIQGYASLTVGASVGATLVDTGGNRGEQYGHIAIHGGREGDGKLNIEGLRYNNMVNTGSGANRHYFVNQAGVQEINLETGGMSAESETGGVAMNVIPKDGGNTLKLYVAINGTNGDLQGNNVTDELKKRGANAATSVKKVWDFGAGLGGPIVKDKLWFYTAHRWWGAQEYPPNTYYNKSANPLVYVADTTRPGFTNLYQRDNSGRLTWQMTGKQKLTFSHSQQSSCLCFQGVEARAPEASIHFKYAPIFLMTGTYTYPRTNKVLFEAGTAYMHNMTQPGLIPGVKSTDISVTELSTGVVYNSPPGSAASIVSMMGNDVYYGQHNERFSMSYVTGSHAFKVGATTHQGVANFGSVFTNEAINYGFRFGVPIQLTQWATPAHSEQSEKLNLGLYVQDQWTLRRLTLNIGIRYDYINSYVPAQVRPATKYVPEFRFSKIENLPNWKDISPRLGAAYDVFGNGKTAVKGFVSRYVGAQGVGIASAVNPANAIVLAATRTWSDANANFVPDCDLTNNLANAECGALNDRAFGTVRTVRRYDPELTNGFGVRDYTWQASASMQHELRPGLGLNVAYFRTWFGNFTTTDNLAVTSADYDPYCINIPADARLGEFGGKQACGFFDIKPAKFGQNDLLVTQAQKFGKQTEIYNGLDVTFSAKFGKGGLLQGGFGTGRTVTNNCYVVDSPEQARDGFCDVTPPWSAQSQVKLAAIYPLKAGFQASANLQNMPGFPITSTYVATNAEVAPSLGRNLAAGAAATVTVPLIPNNTLFEKRYTQLDLRLTKAFRFGKARLQGMFDVYNVMNTDSVINSITRYGPTWLTPTRILGARIFKFGTQVDW
ncbi:MAG: carboxypeptidase regulatory-like domain-containing protein [Vicinamibacterales bacterium]